MILARLKEYADSRMGDTLPPEMYGPVPIRWLVELRADGTLEGFTPLGGDTKANKRGLTMMAPTVIRTVAVRAKLLADNGEYALGIGREGADAHKTGERHSAFVGLTRRCAELTQARAVQAVVRFLEAGPLDPSHLPSGFDPADTLTFRVGGDTLAIDLPAVRAFWAAETAGSDRTAEGRPIMTCLVTGQSGPVEARLPTKIKGIPNGQTAGTALVSANSSAFTSYGLENSLTSPISRDAAERFGKALNHLLADRRSRLYIGPIVYVYWTRHEHPFDPFALLERPTPDEVGALLDAAARGRPDLAVNAEEFFVLALSASGGRGVVRDWLHTTIPAAQASLGRWFRAQAIVDPHGQEGSPLSVRFLASSLYRDPDKELVPSVPARLLRAALHGGPLPIDLLARAIARNRAEGGPDRARAALIKLVLASQEENMADLTSLDPDPPLTDPDAAAYQCGRLLAILESVQRAALGQVNATITDKSYGAASSTPAHGLAPLLPGARAHLAKLRKTRPGAHRALETRLEEVMVALRTPGAGTPTFPSTLTVRQQGIFALGYYHQRADDRRAAEAHANTRGEPA